VSRYNRSFSGNGYPRWTPAVKTLIIACVIAFAVQIIDQLAGGPSIVPKFGLVPSDVTHRYFLWQLVSYIFLHDTGQLFHILFNMLGLWMFGSELERTWGSKEFTKFFFICGIGAGLLTVLFSPNSLSQTIGASGAIYGVLLAFGVLFPDRIIYFLIFPIPAKWFVVIMGALAFLSSLSASGSGIAHVAHLGGMLFGFIYLKGGSMTKIRHHYDRWHRARLRKKFEVYYNDRHRRDDDEPGRRWRN
jgi:membrane associated rhomboid family serine protease